MRERVKRKDERDQQEASRPMTIPIGSETLEASEEFIIARRGSWKNEVIPNNLSNWESNPAFARCTRIK